MAQAKLLLQPHVGLRPVRAHEGYIIALASNQRWSSDGLEIRCWNGEVVRVAFRNRHLRSGDYRLAGQHWRRHRRDGTQPDACLRRKVLQRSACTLSS